MSSSYTGDASTHTGIRCVERVVKSRTCGSLLIE